MHVIKPILGDTPCNYHHDACKCREKKFREMEIEISLLKEKIAEYEDSYDPTPYCGACGSMTKKHCKCGPIADNE